VGLCNIPMMRMTKRLTILPGGERGEARVDIVSAVGCYIRDLLMLPHLIRRMMATQQEVLDKLTAVGAGVDNIAGDVANIKQQLADALAGQDQAVQSALQPVSDALDALVTKTQALADATPDPETPVPPADNG
jgi:hypothetical protein